MTTNNPAESPRAAIYLINHSSLPVYVMSLEYRERLVMATPDQYYEARVRAAHEAASYLVRPGSGEVFELNWEALMDLDASLTEQNPPTTQPPPADHPPLAAQHSELLLVYGEQVVRLQVAKDNSGHTFESLALDYVNLFGSSSPQWFSMPRLVTEAVAAEERRPSATPRPAADVSIHPPYPMWESANMSSWIHPADVISAKWFRS